MDDVLMAQFDVFRNTGKQRLVIPCLVSVQSAIYDDLRRRVVITLVDRAAFGDAKDLHFIQCLTPNL
jgi:CcdB protein